MRTDSDGEFVESCAQRYDAAGPATAVCKSQRASWRSSTAGTSGCSAPKAYAVGFTARSAKSAFFYGAIASSSCSSGSADGATAPFHVSYFWTPYVYSVATDGISSPLATSACQLSPGGELTGQWAWSEWCPSLYDGHAELTTTITWTAAPISASRYAGASQGQSGPPCTITVWQPIRCAVDRRHGTG